MKKLLTKALMLCTIISFAAGFTACQEGPEGDNGNVAVTLAAELIGVENNTATISIATTGTKELAYLVLGAAEQAPMAVVIFKDGVVIPVEGETFSLPLSDLEYETDYTVYIAARTNKGGFHNQVVSADFTTGDYTSDVTIIRYGYDGADIRVNIPEAVKQRGNKLKWFVSSYPDNKMWKPGPTGYFTDAELVQQNDNTFPAFLIHKDTTLRIREENRIFVSGKDETGADVYDEYYQRIAPGEPMIVSIQEVLYQTDDSGSGWGPGWYGTPFLWEEFMGDYYAVAGGGGVGWSTSITDTTRASALPSEENYWPEDSWHTTLRITTKQPTPLNAGVTIGLQGYDGTDKLSPKGGKVTFVPDEGVYCYCVSILDHGLYQSVLLDWLEGKRDRLQWFVTSMFAAREGLATTIYANVGPTSLDIAEWFNNNIKAGGTYHVFVTAMGATESAIGVDADPTVQSFTQYTFEVPNYSLPAPEIKVTGLESTNPFEVKWNIKCTTTDTAPLEKASFACNYVRDFNIALNTDKYTFAELVTMNTLNGIYFSDSEVAQMNTPEGYDVTFDSREDAASGLVVMGWNYEGRPSNPDAEGAEAYAEARSAHLPDAEIVNSDLFTELLGDWTATTTLHATRTIYLTDDNGDYIYDENNKVMTRQENISQEVKSKVSIGDLKHPEAMSQADYKVYSDAGLSKEKADALFSEFKDLASTFNRKVRGQNRLLCQGLDFDELETSYKDILNLESAWDLFVSPTYSSYSVEDNFYDFGPKWYLQIDKDGNVFVPVNMNRILPLTNSRRAEVHLVGYDLDNNQALIAPQTDSDDASTWPNLPVDISDDKNTLTIKPHVYTYDTTNENGEPVKASHTFYPNLIINSNTAYGMFPLSGKIKGNIVLTRGWKEETGDIIVDATIDNEISRSSVAKRNETPIKSANGAQVEVKQAKKQRTNLAFLTANKSKVKYTEVKAKGIDYDNLFKGTTRK